MLKRYAKWQLGKWWPLILVLFLFYSLPFVTILQGASLTVAPPYRSYSFTIEVAYSLLLITCLVSTFVLPPFIFAYRDSINGADSLYQAGFSRKTLRRTRVLLGLAILAMAFTAAYFFGVFVLGIRYLAIPETRVVGEATYTRITIYFGYIFVAYFGILAIIVAQYFINCFFASLGNSTLVQLMLMACGAAILSLALSAPIAYISQMARFAGNQDASTANARLFIYGPIGSGLAAYEFLVEPIRAGVYTWDPSTAGRLSEFIIGLALGCGAFVAMWFMKEPSGEFAGKWRPRHWVITMIPHLAALLIGIILCTFAGGNIGATIIGGYTMMVFFDGTYFCLLALMRRSFRMKRIDLIAFLVVAILMIFLCTGMSVSARDAYFY